LGRRRQHNSLRRDAQSLGQHAPIPGDGVALYEVTSTERNIRYDRANGIGGERKASRVQTQHRRDAVRGSGGDGQRIEVASERRPSNRRRFDGDRARTAAGIEGRPVSVHEPDHRRGNDGTERTGPLDRSAPSRHGVHRRNSKAHPQPARTRLHDPQLSDG
jgi:hypothetical protein